MVGRGSPDRSPMFGRWPPMVGRRWPISAARTAHAASGPRSHWHPGPRSVCPRRACRCTRRCDHSC